MSAVVTLDEETLRQAAQTKYSDDQPRADDGKWTSGGGSGGGGSGSEPSGGGGDGSPTTHASDQQYHNPADGKYHVKDDVEAAVRLIGEGEDVVLEQPREVATLMERLAAIGKSGDKKVYDLCRVSVAGTNLFCAESAGYKRVDMPQLSGAFKPGSPASELPKDSKGGVDATPQFIESLRDKGYAVQATTEDAGYLRATQRELDGAKVAGMMKAIQEGKIPDEVLVVSRDNYIIDGHHRWAAKVALGYSAQVTMDMPIVRVDIPVVPLVEEAKAFANKIGIPQRGVGKSFACSGGVCDVPKRSAVHLDTDTLRQVHEAGVVYVKKNSSVVVRLDAATLRGAARHGVVYAKSRDYVRDDLGQFAETGGSGGEGRTEWAHAASGSNAAKPYPAGPPNGWDAVFREQRIRAYRKTPEGEASYQRAQQNLEGVLQEMSAPHDNVQLDVIYPQSGAYYQDPDESGRGEIAVDVGFAEFARPTRLESVLHHELSHERLHTALNDPNVENEIKTVIETDSPALVDEGRTISAYARSHWERAEDVYNKAGRNLREPLLDAHKFLAINESLAEAHRVNKFPPSYQRLEDIVSNKLGPLKSIVPPLATPDLGGEWPLVFYVDANNTPVETEAAAALIYTFEKNGSMRIAPGPKLDESDDITMSVSDIADLLRGVQKYDPNQPRDELGRFGETGTSISDGSEDFSEGGGYAADAPVESPSTTVRDPSEQNGVLVPVPAFAVAAAEKKLTKEGYSPEHMNARMDALMDYAKANPDIWNEGMIWYAREHEFAKELAARGNLTDDQGSAVLAAVSPRQEVALTEDQALAIVEATNRDGSLEITEQLIQANYDRQIELANGKPKMIAFAERERDRALHNDIGTHDVVTGDAATVARWHSDRRAILANNWEKGLRIARGELPEEVLGGQKVWSFYDNIRNPEDSGSVTIDAWMIKALTDDDITEDDSIKLIGKAEGRQASGRYEVMSRRVRETAQRYNVTPLQAQAIAWTAYRAQNIERAESLAAYRLSELDEP